MEDRGNVTLQDFKISMTNFTRKTLRFEQFIFLESGCIQFFYIDIYWEDIQFFVCDV